MVTWRRAQTVLLSAQGMPVDKTATVTCTSSDRVRDVMAEQGLPFSTGSLAKLADFLVTEGVVDDISHEGLRVLLREEGVSFQRVKTWKTSHDPDYAVKKARIEHLQWGYTRPHGVRHLFAAYDLAKNQLYGHIKKTKNRSKFLEFCRYLRSLHRDRPHPDQQLLAQPDRGPVHRPALLRPRRHRPHHPQGRAPARHCRRITLESARNRHPERTEKLCALPLRRRPTASLNSSSSSATSLACYGLHEVPTGPAP
nr:hypothetical protein [Streptomyces regalis]